MNARYVQAKPKFWPWTITPAGGQVDRGCMALPAQRRGHQVSGSNSVQQRTLELTPGFPVLDLLRFGLRVAKVQAMAV